MGLSHSPSITTDGLVLCLDAANPRSYPGSGNSWLDLSGRANNASLVNSPVFSSNDAGGIVFDGVNDYSIITNFNEDSNDALSVFAWVNLTSETLYSNGNYMNWIINKRDNSNDRQWQLITFRDPSDINIRVPHVSIMSGSSTIGLSLYNGDSSAIRELNLNEWGFVGFTTSGVSGGFLRVYLNGLLNTYTTLSANRGKGSRDLIIGDTAWQYPGIIQWDGLISGIQIYNRALSADEVRRNYLATKSRFGL